MDVKNITVNNDNYMFVCQSGDTKSGFKHEVTLFRNGCQIAESVCYYINRTWEQYHYQSAMQTAVRNKMEYISNRLLNRFKSEHGYSKLTANRKKDFETLLNADTEYNNYKSLYDIISDYYKFMEVLRESRS